MPGDCCALAAQLSRPMGPQPTEVSASIQNLPDIKAVIFDVYGTLLISGSGDIGLTSSSDLDREEIIGQALREEGLVTTPALSLAEKLVEAIAADHTRAIQDGASYPEIEIREIWSNLLQANGIDLSGPAIERLAIRYEAAVNPVWPMPNALQTLITLRDLGHLLGIVSNAQFYTPIFIESLFERSLSDLGFTDSLCLWSYKVREAKPSKGLFVNLAHSLSKKDIKASQAVYVGNDMRNDIATASAVGFRTALFAGDARSLRWREDDRLKIKPDLILTDLAQLLDCFLVEDDSG